MKGVIHNRYLFRTRWWMSQDLPLETLCLPLVSKFRQLQSVLLQLDGYYSAGGMNNIAAFQKTRIPSLFERLSMRKYTVVVKG